MTLSPLDARVVASASTALIGELYLNGEQLSAQLAQVITDVKHKRTIDGVNTLTVELFDDSRQLLRSGIFNTRSVLALDFTHTFELVQVRKSGEAVTLTFEDFITSELRKRSDPFKVEPNTTNHVDFVHRLVTELPGILLASPPGGPLAPVSTALTELARGNPTDGTREDSWTAIRRIGDERGWRAFVRDKVVHYAPETWLIAQEQAYHWAELRDGVDYIDFDFDMGKPVATAKTRVRAPRYDLRIGDVIQTYELGPGDGRWIIAEVDRSLYDLHADVTLTRARPVLPEREPSSGGESSVGANVEGDLTVTFGDGRRRTYSLRGVKPHVRAAAEELGTRFAIDTIYGVGSRPNKSDHPLGLALDYMCSRAQGDALADYAYANAGRLKVKYIIWRQRIRYPGGGWKRMADRGGATANHEDHVHISFHR